MHHSIDIETAIIVLKNLQDWLYFSSINGGTTIQREAINIAIKALEVEPFTDAEQRIFLTAITREKEKCKEIDGELDGLVNLKSICEEIERKVKSVLWN